MTLLGCSTNFSDVSPEKALHDLLCSLFEAAALRRFLRFGTQGDAIIRELPGESVSVAELADRAIVELGRRGLVSSTMRRLSGEFPNRYADISQVIALLPNDEPDPLGKSPDKLNQLEVIGYSRNLLGGQNDLGVLRVSRFKGEAKSHVRTAKGWEAQALDKETEEVIDFRLSMRRGRKLLHAESIDSFPTYRLNVEVFLAEVRCSWSTLNDVGERIWVEAEMISLPIRCDLKAACAVLPDE